MSKPARSLYFPMLLLLIAFSGQAYALGQKVEEMMARIEENGDLIVVEVPAHDSNNVLLRTIWMRTDQRPHQYKASVQWGAGEATGPYRIDRPLEKALGIYLDERVHFEKKGVMAEAPVPELLADMEGIVNALVDNVDRERPEFHFSEGTRERLLRLTKIDWTKASFGVDGDDQEKYLAIFYYVRSQRNELERSVKDDLLELAYLALRPTDDKVRDAVLLASVCGTVFDEDFLCALDLTIAPSPIPLHDPGLSADVVGSIIANEERMAVNDAEIEVKLRKRDRWLKAELDRLNERMDRLDNTKEVYELKDLVGDLQAQIDDIRLEMREIDSRKMDVGNPIAALSNLTGKNVTIRFRSGSTRIDPDHNLLLNEVFSELARSTSARILITGYADAVGDPAANLRLSERRARSVRSELMRRGITAERLLVNYFGESQSQGHGTDERRVEIEWLAP